MGLRRSYLDFIQDSVAATLGSLQGREMLELGNQRIARRQGIREKTGKAWFTQQGARHTSLDFNGKDGAVALDLSQRIDRPEWSGHFDLITNPGTTEHVEPHAAQYECFANLHDWLKPGGIVVHIVPGIEELESHGRWKNHCNHYYSARFFADLAAANDYELVASTVLNDLRAVCLRKCSDRPFASDRQALLAGITRREGGIVYHGIDDPERRRPMNVARRFLRKLGWR
jgi:SAM-dependent methyltransferase